MPNKDIFKELIKKLERQKKGLSDPRIMHPEREWAIGVVVMILVFLGSAYWSSQMYFKNRNVTSTEVVSDGVVVYKEAIVTDVLERFQKSKEQYAQLTQGTVILPEEPEVIASSTQQTSEITTPDFTVATSSEEQVLRSE